MKDQILAGFREKWYVPGFTNGVDDSKYWLYQAANGGDPAMEIESFLNQALERVEEEMIKGLEEIEKSKWDDAEHCSCLGCAIYELRTKEKETPPKGS